jgi:hypothetical protein
MRYAWLVGLVVWAGCGAAKVEAPAPEKTGEGPAEASPAPPVFAPGSEAMLYSDDGDSVFVTGEQLGRAKCDNIPVGTRVRIIEVGEEGSSRRGEVRFNILEGPHSGKVGNVIRAFLRPVPRPRPTP